MNHTAKETSITINTAIGKTPNKEAISKRVDTDAFR